MTPASGIIESPSLSHPSLKTASFRQPSKEKSSYGNALEIALGGAQVLGGIASDLSAQKPAQVKDSTSAVMNTLALETKNAASSTASRMMDIATNRADKDFAANMAEARRSSGGNAAVTLMSGVQSAEQGKEAVAKASEGASQVIMQANKDASSMIAEGTKSALQTAMFNTQLQNEQYMRQKDAAGELTGAGLKGILDAVSYNRYKKEEKAVKDKNNVLNVISGK